MTVRILERGEWPRIAPLFKEAFKETPPPIESACIVVAEDGGEIIAFTVLQILQVAEPTWVKADWRGPRKAGAVCKRLFDFVRDVLRPQYFFAHTKDPRVGRLLSRWGMTNMQMETWRWTNNG